jgi:hypothetical protein
MFMLFVNSMYQKSATESQYTGISIVCRRETPPLSVVLTEVCRTLPLKHPSGNVKGNCRTAKLSIVMLPNWRVSDAESKRVGGAVERNGSSN